MKQITWYREAEKKGAKAGTVPKLTTDPKKAALNEEGRPIIVQVEIRGDDDGTD